MDAILNATTEMMVITTLELAGANYSVVLNNSTQHDYIPERKMTTVDSIVLVLCIIFFIVAMLLMYYLPSPKGETNNFLDRLFTSTNKPVPLEHELQLSSPEKESFVKKKAGRVSENIAEEHC